MSNKNGEVVTETPNEEKLIQRVKKGDQKAEVLIFNHFSGRIDAMVRNRLGYNNEDWQDVAISIKAAVLISIRDGRYQSDKAPLHIWIQKITQYQITKYIRDRNPLSVDLDSLPEFILANTDKNNLERDEGVRIIKNILKKLPKKYQTVFHLKYFEGLTPKEISVELSMPVKTIYEYSNYAVQLIKKKCKEKRIFQDFLD